MFQVDSTVWNSTIKRDHARKISWNQLFLVKALIWREKCWSRFMIIIWTFTQLLQMPLWCSNLICICFDGDFCENEYKNFICIWFDEYVQYFKSSRSNCPSEQATSELAEPNFNFYILCCVLNNFCLKFGYTKEKWLDRNLHD